MLTVRSNMGCLPLSDDEMLAFLQANVRTEGACLIWAGSFYAGTQRPRIIWRRKERPARRLLMELSGISVKGRTVYSVCGDTRCMNIGHLRAGTRASANRQNAKAGHLLTGARRSIASMLGHVDRARLSVRDAPDVLRMRAAGDTNRVIGARYNVTESRVSDALRTWRRAGIAA